MARRGRDLERGALSSPERGSQSRAFRVDPWANYSGTERQGGLAVPGDMPPGFCTQVGGPGSGGGLGTVPVLPRDATRVMVPSSPGESSSNGRPAAKARGVAGPVMSAPFVQGSLFQQQMPVGNGDPVSVMMSQMSQMMQTVSNFQSEVSSRLAVLERRENLQQTVLTGCENPRNFGESYGVGQGGSFNRLGIPIRENRSSRDEVDVFSKSEKWLHHHQFLTRSLGLQGNKRLKDSTRTSSL